MNNRCKFLVSVGLAAGIASGSTAMAQEAEDDSSAFQASNEEMGAALGLPAPESTVTTREDGTTSAVVGLSAMKMLVVRQNADGSMSMGHASSAAEADAFVNTQQTGPAEE